MLQGDRSYLKASLTRGILDMQNRLIKLYIVNLQAIGTQAAFIAGFSFLGIGAIIMPKTGSSWNGLHYFFDFFIHLAFCLCLWATSHATLITIYGPSVALKGVEFDTVNSVGKMIQRHKYFVLTIGIAALTCLFIASIMNYWAKLIWQVAIVVTIINIVGFIIIVIEGIKVYNIFHPDDEIVVLHFLNEYSWTGFKRYSKPSYRHTSSPGEANYDDVSYKNNSNTFLKGNANEQKVSHDNYDANENNLDDQDAHDGTMSEASAKTKDSDKVGKVSTPQRRHSLEGSEPEHASSNEMLYYQQLTQTRARGIIWWKSPISSGGDGKFHSRFADIEKGLLNFYRNEEAFNSNEYPINAQPYQIWIYRLVTDPSRFPKGITSGVKSVRKRVIGQGEFSLFQVMSSEYDLKEAVNRFRFVLLSEISSELTHFEPIELMANNEEQYQLWINAFSKVISGYCYMDSSKASAEEYTLSGNASLETVVRAANSKA